MKDGSFRKWNRPDLTYSIWNYNLDLWTESPDLHRDQQAAAIRSIRNLGLYELSCYSKFYQPHFFCSFFLEDAPGIRCP